MLAVDASQLLGSPVLHNVLVLGTLTFPGQQSLFEQACLTRNLLCVTLDQFINFFIRCRLKFCRVLVAAFLHIRFPKIGTFGKLLQLSGTLALPIVCCGLRIGRMLQNIFKRAPKPRLAKDQKDRFQQHCYAETDQA